MDAHSNPRRGLKSVIRAGAETKETELDVL